MTSYMFRTQFMSNFVVLEGEKKALSDVNIPHASNHFKNSECCHFKYNPVKDVDYDPALLLFLMLDRPLCFFPTFRSAFLIRGLQQIDPASVNRLRK